MQTAKVFKDSFNRANLFYEVRPKVNQDKEIVKFIKQNEEKYWDEIIENAESMESDLDSEEQ